MKTMERERVSMCMEKKRKGDLAVLFFSLKDFKEWDKAYPH